MGYYINKTSSGQPLGNKTKYQQLIDDGGQPVAGDKFEPNLVCVVDNGAFQAAGYCYSQAEFEDFKYPDGRKRQWLTHPKAAELANFN